MSNFEVSQKIESANLIVVVTAISAALLELIDSTAVNVALREMSGGLGATTTEIAWVVTAYAIGNVIMIPLSAICAQVFGRKNYFTASIIVFTVMSLLCGISTSLWHIMAFRFFQGLAGGGLLTTAQSIIIGSFPKEKINTATSIFGLGVVLGPAIGPILGGFIVDNYSWHWIFFINIPIGIVATLLSVTHIPDLEGSHSQQKIDVWGILFLTVALAFLQYVLEEGEHLDWFASNLIAILTSLALFAFIAFIRRELVIDYPAVNIRLYKNSNLAMGGLMNFIVGAILLTTLYILPLFVQIILGWSASKTGSLMVVRTVASVVGMVLTPKLIAKGMNPKIIMLSGLLLTIVFLFMMSFSTSQTPEQFFVIPLIIAGLGTSFLMLPVLSMAVAGLRGTDLAQGTGLSNMFRQLGGPIGIAFINLYLNKKIAIANTVLIANINPYNNIATDRINGIAQNFINNGYGTDQAYTAAFKLLNASVNLQQTVLAYNQGYFFIGLCLLLCVPVILLIKNPATSTEQKKVTLH